jgi:hypothetical protein
VANATSEIRETMKAAAILEVRENRIRSRSPLSVLLAVRQPRLVLELRERLNLVLMLVAARMPIVLAL